MAIAPAYGFETGRLTKVFSLTAVKHSGCTVLRQWFDRGTIEGSAGDA
ncbi:hypothetical protein AB0D13_10165 [Streptomyces sp. NPDC048430]